MDSIIRMIARLPLIDRIYAAGVVDGRKAAANDIMAAPIGRTDGFMDQFRAAYIAEGGK